MNIDLYNNVAIDSTKLMSATLTSTTASTSLDLANFDSNIFAVYVADTADTINASNYIEIEVQESDASGSGFTACADDDIYNAITGTTTGTAVKIDAADEDDKCYKVSYNGGKRYARLNIRLTGTHSNGSHVTVIGLKGNARKNPV